VSDEKTTSARGWLPSLNAGQRFRSGIRTEPEGEQVATVEQPESEPAAVDRNRNHLLVQDWSSALESQFGLSAPESPVSESADETMATLRERLAYYEHFDDLIRDNIARSAALFQAVFEEREKARKVQAEAESTMNAVSVEAERRAEAERQHVQNILMSLMDEATFLHQRSDALIQRLAEALTEMAPQSDEGDEPVAGA
jgi:hypothetical protein